MEAPKTFANNFWGKDDLGHTRLIQRMHHAKQTTEELMAHYRERLSIEEDYHKRLANLSRKGLGVNETGDFKRSLDTVRMSTEAMAKGHETLARQLAEDMLGPLETFAASLRERRRTAEDTMARLTKSKASQNAATEKSRAKYEAECHKVTGYLAQQNLLMGRELEKNNIKLERSQIAVEGLQRQYRDNLRSLSDTMEVWNREWKVACDKFQDLEEERLNFLKSNLWAYANAVSSSCVGDDEGCEAIRVALEKCDPSRDIGSFVDEKGTGSKIIDAPEFCNFLGGFTRDNDDGHFKVANFTRGDDEHESMSHGLDESLAQSVAQNQVNSYDTRSVAPTLDNGSSARLNLASSMSQPSLRAPNTIGHMSHNSQDSTSWKSVPDLQPSSEAAFSAAGASSPDSSIYSNNSPQFAQTFEPMMETKPIVSKQVEKRRSWALPFKRQSTPDLSRIWKSGDSNRASNGGHHDYIPSEHQTTQSRSSNTHSQQQSSDPLLAAMERLRTETNTPTKTRPISMPGVSVAATGSGPTPYGNGRATHADQGLNRSLSSSSNGNRSPARRQVGTGHPSPYQTANQYHNQPQQEYVTPARYTQHAYAPAVEQAQQAQQSQQAQAPRADTTPTQRARPKSHADVHNNGQVNLPTRTSDGRRVLRYSRAQYDYRAAIPEETSFRKGDILLVAAMQEDGWWDVEVLGKNRFGLAPSNFLVSI